MEQKFNSIRWVFGLLVISFLFCPIGIWAQGSGTKTYPRETLAARVIKLSKDYKVNVMYNPGQKDISVPELTVNDHDIQKVLDKTLASTDFTYKKTAGTSYVIVKRTTSSQPAKQPARSGKGTLSGSVVDERGEPIPGATIIIKGSTLGTITDLDGKFAFRDLLEGTKTVTVSFLSFETLQINDVKIEHGKTTALNVAMKTATLGLGEVVVTASYKSASTSGLLALQKNSASVSDGISSEQLSRTPDNNIGQVLKRVSGVTTIDNKYVVVRGLSDRYNQAMIDGVVLPSTNMNRRNFSFDMLPQELVSSVVVNKTATPDLPAEFSGGQISVNTMDIPDENFTSLTIGTGMNTQSTGKEFLMLGERKTGDYLGLSNSAIKQPEGLQSWYWYSNVTTPPLGPNGDYPADMPEDLELLPGSGVDYRSLDAIEQSRRINAGGLKVNAYKAVPFQNLRFALGRVYDLKDNLRFGFSGGATYRNQQTIVDFNNVRGNYAGYEVNYMDSLENGAGKSYRFNSTVGIALNMGIQGKNFKLAFKNMYSRIFQDEFNQAYRIAYGASNEYKYRELFENPQSTSVWQHKLEGENLLGSTGIKLNYTVGITRIGQQIQDQRRLKYRLTEVIGGQEYLQTPNIYGPGQMGGGYDYRMWTDVKETDYNWGLTLSKSFSLGSRVKNTAQLGYSGWDKNRSLSVFKMIPYTSFTNRAIEGLYPDILSAERVGAKQGQAYYWAENLNGPTFDGKMVTHAPYLMLDQRFFDKLRLVYGVRAEHYNLDNRQEEYARNRFGGDSYEMFMTVGEKNWRFLPSVNLTYSLTSQMNLRFAYSKTAIRPDFRETAYFGFYDYELDANISGRQLTSTIIDNFDLRYEWYPAAGEVISVSGFYKKMKDPIELVSSDMDGYYRFQNQHAAKNYGVELELRKSLGFIADKEWLHNLSIFGNGTILKSKIEVQTVPLPNENKESERLPNQDRPLYGQAPWVINAGVAYQDNVLGATASYNRSGHRSNTINLNPAMVEYENGRNLLDLQISYRVLKQKGEIKLNVSNLLDEYILFYKNNSAFLQEEAGEGFEIQKGSTAYEPEHGDRVTYRSKTGRNISLSFGYKF